MINWREIPRHTLPVSIPAEYINSDENLYDYRKPDHYYDNMPDFETLRNAVNNHKCTLRELIYEISEYGHIYYIVNSNPAVSAIAMMWTPNTALLNSRGEKRYKKLLDCEVAIHDRGLLVIDTKDTELLSEYIYGLMDIGDGKRYFYYSTN